MATHRYMVIPSNGQGSEEDPVYLGSHESFAKAEEYFRQYTGMNNVPDHSSKPGFLILEVDTGRVHTRKFKV